MLIISASIAYAEPSLPYLKYLSSDSSLVTIPSEVNYKAGILHTKESYEDINSQEIKVPFYYFLSADPLAQKRPTVILLLGGPGSSISGLLPYIRNYRYLDNQNLLLVEQRGSGLSTPDINCPHVKADSEIPSGDIQRVLPRCRDYYENSNINLQSYNTSNIASDVEDIVSKLNIQSVSIVSLSYGSAVAFALLENQKLTIDKVVLDSAIKPRVNYDYDYFSRKYTSIRNVFSQCNNNTECENQYGDAVMRFLEPPSEIAIDELIGYTRISRFPSHYNLETIVSEYQQYQKADDSTRKKLNNSETTYFGANYGMRISVWCQEFYKKNTLFQSAFSETKSEEFRMQTYPDAVCENWPVKPLEFKYNSKKHSQNVLFINGEHDAFTPPDWAKDLQGFFLQSTRAVFQKQSHTPTTNWSNGCAMKMAVGFLIGGIVVEGDCEVILRENIQRIAPP